MKRICIVGDRGHLGIALEGVKASRECEIAGVCGSEPGIPAERVAETCARAIGHAPHIFQGDYREMLDAIAPDAVVVCGQFEEHSAMTAEAVARKIHVFCEKPAATTLEGLAVLERALKGNPEVKVAQMCGPHYEPGMWGATRLAPYIGTIRLLDARKSYKRGKRAAYFTQRHTSSGLIPWVGIHAISWLYHFAGRVPFRSVCASHSNAFNKGLGDMEMSAACLFQFETGISATVSIDYFRPENPELNHGDDRLRVVGTDGTLEVESGRCHMLTGTKSETFSETPPKGMFEDFLQCIDEKPSNIMTGIDLLRITQAALLARESADTQKRLAFPEGVSR